MGIFVLSGLVISAVIGALIGKTKGRVGEGAACGLILGPIGWLIIALVKDKREEKALESGAMKKCPYCAELIKSEAKVCRYCGKEQDESNVANLNTIYAADLGWVGKQKSQNKGRSIKKVLVIFLVVLGAVVAGLFVLFSLGSDEAEAIREAKKVLQGNLDSNIESDYRLNWVRADVVVKEKPYYVVYLVADVKKPNLRKYRHTVLVGVKFLNIGHVLVGQPSICSENPGAEEIRRFADDFREFNDKPQKNAEEEADEAASRKLCVDFLSKHFQDEKKDIKFWASGPGNKYLNMQSVVFNEVTVHNLRRNGDLFQSIKQLRFERVYFTDGSQFSTYFDL
jgi:hypothetical protein